MESDIKRLEKETRKLEPSFEDRITMTAKVIRYGQQFLQSLPDGKAYEPSDGAGAGLLEHPFTETGQELDQLLQLLDKEVDTPGINPASGGHLGYIPGGGVYPSALGDYLAAVTNRYAGIFFSNPGAVRMENMCIRWMCDLAGYSEKAGGNLTSGGSIANLTALVTARDHAGLHSTDYEKAVIYTTRQVHHCVIKAIKFAGLADAHLRVIPMDERYRMNTDLLRQEIEKDRANSLKPLVIFASAGTTDLGAVDPLENIADVAEKYNLWFHVDAAYGGFFLLTDHGQEVMKGIDRADSITIDPHKGLFLPYGSGALLVKDVQQLYNSQHMSANYLQDTLSATQEHSPADLSPELSKHFRGLRMWLALKLTGVAPFRAALNEKLLLSRYFHHELQHIERMETGPEPELSVQFFRYVPEEGDANAFNKKLVERIHEDGRVFLSSTNIGGTFYIRLAVLSFRTHKEHIDLTLDILKAGIEELNT